MIPGKNSAIQEMDKVLEGRVMDRNVRRFGARRDYGWKGWQVKGRNEMEA